MIRIVTYETRTVTLVTRMVTYVTRTVTCVTRMVTVVNEMAVGGVGRLRLVGRIVRATYEGGFTT